MPVKATDPVYLQALSPKDKKWDERRAEASAFRDLYTGTKFHKHSKRIDGCARLLEFGFSVSDDGVSALKLQRTWFCRVRHCPVCQWRRSLMWRARAFAALPKVLEHYPKARFIFLTLTVRNCELSELRQTLTQMNKSWTLLTKRKEWPALGWIRSVEVTRSRDDTAHPHFHCLLMVPPSYFKGGAYLSQKRWSEVWRSCLKVDYDPIIHVQVVKPLKGTQKGEEGASMLSAVCETLKYSVKPSDVLRDESSKNPSIDNKGGATYTAMSNQDWLVNMTEHLKKTRAVAVGGVLKDFMKALEDEPEDLIHVDESGITEIDNDSPRVFFGWRERLTRYTLAGS